MRSPIPLAILIAIALVFSGCLAGDDPEPEDDQDTEDTTGDDAVPEQTEEEPELYVTIEEFAADPTEGVAPLNVTFSWDVDTNDTDAQWSLEFGDGDTQEGALAESDDSFIHEFQAGNFTVAFTVQLSNGDSVEESLDLSIEEATPIPDQLLFEYGPSLGCEGSAGPCISEVLGPDQEPVDAFWQALDESYWGLDFTVRTGIDYEDTDCRAYDADQEPIESDLNGGPGPCEGPLPEGTHWLLLYSYVAPSPSMELEFTL